MTELCVEEIELNNPELNTFVRELENKHGKIFTLRELFACDQKLGNEIILGVVDSVFPITKQRNRHLLLMRLCEVTMRCQRGQFFNVYAFNKFATSLADVHLQKDDFAAFRSVYIQEDSQFRMEEGCRDLEAHIGIPEQESSKIFFARKSHITNAGTSGQPCPFLSVSVETYEVPGTIMGEPTRHMARTSSRSLTETSCNSIHVSLAPGILNNVSSSVLPSTSSQIQREFDNSTIAVQTSQNKNTYKKLSELVEPDKKVNIYGVINTIAKMPREDCKHAVVRLKDETCRPGQDFRVHIFFGRDTAFPKLEHGYILRLQRLKTELFDGVLDGRVFRAADVVTFPPEGQGMANAFSTSKCFYFCDSDANRLAELRRWIASQKQQQPLPVTRNTTSLPVVPSSEPTKSLLSDIKKEGNYILHCKVISVDVLSDEMRIFTVTDGTLFIYCFHLDEDERHSTYEVRIIFLNPSPEVKKIKKGALVEFTNVTVLVTVPPDSSLCNWPYLSFKMDGNDCSVKIFKGIESEAQALKRRLHDARFRRRQQHLDPVDLLITELTSDNPYQMNFDNRLLVFDAESDSSVQNDFQQSEMTTNLFTCNSHPVQQYHISSGGGPSLQSGDQWCLPPLISHAAEGELNCQAQQKSVLEQGITNVQQVCLREQSVSTGNLNRRNNTNVLSKRNMQQDFLAGSTLNDNCVQEINETYSEFCNGVLTSSNARYRSSTHSIRNQNTNPVVRAECLRKDNMTEVQSPVSEIVTASEADSWDASCKFPALTQLGLRDTELSNNDEAETLIFMDVSSDASPEYSNTYTSVPTRVKRYCVPAKCKSKCVVNVECTEEDSDSSCTIVGEWEAGDEDMECQMHDDTVGCQEKFVSGITNAVQGIPTDICHIKKKRIQNGEQQVYLLKAWVKDIEPPINDGSKMNIVSGSCNSCKYTMSYQALKLKQKSNLLCQYCFQKGQKIPVTLGYLLRLHLIDENNDELIVTVAGKHGVELLGCTVNAYLYDGIANRRVVKMLTALIAKNKNVPPQNRGPMLKLLVTPVYTSMGTEYIVHNTYLCSDQNLE